jgi:hypothetical protein
MSRDQVYFLFFMSGSSAIPDPDLGEPNQSGHGSETRPNCLPEKSKQSFSPSQRQWVEIHLEMKACTGKYVPCKYGTNSWYLIQVCLLHLTLKQRFRIQKNAANIVDANFGQLPTARRMSKKKVSYGLTVPLRFN